MNPAHPEKLHEPVGLDSFVLSESRPTPSVEPVVVRGVQFSAFSGKSPHPYFATAYVAFIPTGITVGAEAVARLTATLSSFPRTQERMTREIHDVLRRCLAPDGVVVRIEARHGSPAGEGGSPPHPIVTTQAVSGRFEEAFSRSCVTGLFRRSRRSPKS